MPPPAEELVLAPPASPTPLRHARSTILIGSIGVLRAQGRFEEYRKSLPAAHAELLLNAVAGTWVPLDVALSHYEACDALNLSHDVQTANGRAVFDKTSSMLLGTAFRMAREAGVTPWSVFPLFQRFWERGYDGGGIGIWRTGPKEARIELTHVPLLDSRYYRHALRGLITGITEMFCQKAYVTERPGPRPPGTVVTRVQWA